MPHGEVTALKRTVAGVVPLAELPEMLTVEEAAAVLRIGRSAAYQLARRWRETGGREGLGRELQIEPPSRSLSRSL